MLTPLKLACIGGHARCVARLLDARAALDDDDGSKLDVIEADGSTMLIYAAQVNGHADGRVSALPSDGLHSVPPIAFQSPANRCNRLPAVAIACQPPSAHCLQLIAFPLWSPFNRPPTTVLTARALPLLDAPQRTHARTPAPNDGHVQTIGLLLGARATPHQCRCDRISRDLQ